MTDVDATAKDETEITGETLPRARSLNPILIIGVVVVLAAGGFLLLTQVGSSSGCAGEGPCMLHFYADW